ncbi:MAG: 6-bladed beta-propeller [Candidatus Eisenbacteria bacterium]|nr:6-bladed beta-propeller [Candidatus Eisenbacteria bacterium]
MGQFHYPRGIAVDASGNVYVGDTCNHRIQVFTSSGTYITEWGGLGTGPGQFQGPHGIAFDASGNVYVADKGNYRIQVFCYGQTAVESTTWGRIKNMFR